MTHHSAPAEEVVPGRLLLRTGGACDFDPRHLLEVFGGQRQRFTAVLQGFAPGDWAAPTRCTDWSAHDVVRHLCDANAIAAGTDGHALDLAAGYDPRITPRAGVAASAGEAPGTTLCRFLATTNDLLALARGRLTRGHHFGVRLPYGPVDWTVLLLHAFWDSWLHERDILLAQGREHPTNSDATCYAAAYGVFIAAAVASMFGAGAQVHEKLTLGGDGGGTFDLDSRGTVTLTVTRETVAGPPAAEAADALAGRAPIATALPDLPGRTRTALSLMANFFNTPAGQSPA